MQHRSLSTSQPADKYPENWVFGRLSAKPAKIPPQRIIHLARSKGDAHRVRLAVPPPAPKRPPSTAPASAQTRLAAGYIPIRVSKRRSPPGNSRKRLY